MSEILSPVVVVLNMQFRVSFDAMCQTLDELDREFVDTGGLVSWSLTQRTNEWISACGWTWREFADEVDRRWCEIYELAMRNVKAKKPMHRKLFLC